MTRCASEFRLLAAAIVVLSCSGRDAPAFALCDSCPDLFASTSTAQQTALAEPRVQSTRVHGRYVDRRLQRKLDVPTRPPLARRAALTAFAAVPISGGAIGANMSAVIADSAPPVADEATPATPAFRIDQLFNIMAAGPSDQPEEMAALRADMLSQLHMRQAFDRSGILVPTVIAFGTGLLLIGGILGSARLHAFAQHLPPNLRSDHTMLLRAVSLGGNGTAPILSGAAIAPNLLLVAPAVQGRTAVHPSSAISFANRRPADRLRLGTSSRSSSVCVLTRSIPS